jgi:sterol desaturase/sphingolipid hydroxylase (fatty acid hydroxylase superfamily)
VVEFAEIEFIGVRMLLFVTWTAFTIGLIWFYRLLRRRPREILQFHMFEKFPLLERSVLAIGIGSVWAIVAYLPFFWPFGNVPGWFLAFTAAWAAFYWYAMFLFRGIFRKLGRTG